MGQAKTITNLFFLIKRPVISIKLGRLKFLQVRTSPLAENGLPNKSKESKASFGKLGGKTTSLLLLAEKYLREVILPKVLGSICNWLQSSRSWTRDLKQGNLCGRKASSFLAKSNNRSESISFPEQISSGKFEILFPGNFSSTRHTSLIHSGKVLIELLERSMLRIFLSCRIRRSILFSEIPTACSVSRDPGNPLIG